MIVVLQYEQEAIFPPVNFVLVAGAFFRPNLISTSRLADATTLLLRISLRTTERKSVLGLDFFSVSHGLPPVKTTPKPAPLA
jgi:hypothetical protein